LEGQDRQQKLVALDNQQLLNMPDKLTRLLLNITLDLLLDSLERVPKNKNIRLLAEPHTPINKPNHLSNKMMKKNL